MYFTGRFYDPHHPGSDQGCFLQLWQIHGYVEIFACLSVVKQIKQGYTYSQFSYKMLVKRIIVSDILWKLF